MKRSSYRDRDYAFGQAMLTLRTTIGPTQAGLADFLGVSRRAVGDWEAGSSYPKAEHLKQFLALAIEHQAFPAGREAEEIHALWHAAHQKVLLDEAWLATLLPHSQAVQLSQLAEETSGTGYAPRVDWGEALAVPTFYGRAWEMELLTEWVIQERCRVVSVLGLGGIGKSALAISLMHRVAEHFEVVIWRSLRDIPTCEALLDDCLQVLAPQMLGEIPVSLERRHSLLLEQMRSTRVLLVLDNLESMLEEGEGAGRMRPGYEGFGHFLRLSAQSEHQSCVLLTSREKPGDLVPQEGSHAPVRVLRLARLDIHSCEQLLAEQGVAGTASERAQLIEAYTGNPLALKIVAQTIVDLFDGEIPPFLEQGVVIFGGVRELLAEQFARLSEPEQTVLCWLAIMREPVTLDDLRARLVAPLPMEKVLEAIDGLRQRSLIERGQRPGSFTLQSVVLEYVTSALITEASGEIQQGRLARLIQLGLVQANAEDYVREAQERLLVAPVLEHLQSSPRGHINMEAQLVALLDEVRTWPEDAQGYAPANLLELLRLQQGNLQGLDLSRLVLRGVYLQGVEMQDATLSGAVIRDSILDETFDAIMGIAISNTGAYWAASSRNGEVRIWDSGGQMLHRVWQAHSDLIWSLAFNPDSTLLATGGFDGTIKLWEVASGALLWSGRHPGDVFGVSFAPDGSLIVSSGGNAVILWDVKRGTQVQVLPHPNVVISVAWSPDGRLIASGDVEGHIRLWAVIGTEPAVCALVLAAHKKQVNVLVFSPDGRTLASGSSDGTVKLWESPSGLLRETLTGYIDRVTRMAWSPHGRLLAGGDFEKAIWLWDVEQGKYRSALRGHTDAVTSLAFTSDSRSLISGGDSTLRVWDVASGRCVRVIQGNTVTLFDVDWSPDGTQLASGGSDALVTLCAVTDKAVPRALHGHRGLVFGVGWSPDGQRLASSSWDTEIRLWDPATGDCVQVLQDPDDPNTIFYSIAWSPDGQRLAGATYLNLRGVLIWDVYDTTTRSRRWLSPPHPTLIRRVAWSPDGLCLAGGGYDTQVYVWNTADGTLRQQLTGHQRAVKSIAWSPDGTRLASGGSGREGGELFVWDAQRGEHLRTMVGHPEIVYALAWGANDERLISGGDDGALRWWDVQNGKCLWVREAHQGMVQSLRRSPDGRQLASGGADGAIMLWDLQSGEHLQTLRRDRPYERLNITGIRGLTEAQKETLRALGAFEETRKSE